MHRQGKGIRAIARETGIARNTIRAILAGESDGHYGPRRPRPTKIDAHNAYVQERIEAAGKIRLPATVLLREIRGQGYEGGITQLKEYLREIRPAPPDEPVVRFETEPGRQLQIDFVVFRRGDVPLRAFTAELGFSRYSYVDFTGNESGVTLVACLERALQYFGGAPVHVLCDNPKTIVIERNAYGDGLHPLPEGLAGFRQALRPRSAYSKSPPLDLDALCTWSCVITPCGTAIVPFCAPPHPPKTSRQY